jgi:hypothetical protein
MVPLSHFLRRFSLPSIEKEKRRPWQTWLQARCLVSGLVIGVAVMGSAHAQALAPGKAVSWGSIFPSIPLLSSALL